MGIENFSRDQKFNIAKSEIGLRFLKLNLDYDTEMIILALALRKLGHMFSKGIDVTEDVTIEPYWTGELPETIRLAEWVLHEAAKKNFTHGEIQMMIGQWLTSSASYIIRAEREEDDDAKKVGK